MKYGAVLLLFFASLWSACIYDARHASDTSDNVYKGPIIDMHIHAYADNDPFLGSTHPATLRGVSYEGVKTAAEQKAQVLQKFRDHNIVRAMVTDGEPWQADAPATIMIAKYDRPVEELRKLHAEGRLQAIAEMDPFYRGIRADDSSQNKYFQLAQELQIPVGVHIFPGGPNNGLASFPDMLNKMRVYNADPLQLENVLAKFPKLKVWIMHGGWPYTEDVKALMYAHANLYVDIAVVNWLLPKKECYNYIQSLTDAGFGDRIMYGSDEMVWPQLIDVGIETIRNASALSLKQKEDILYNNAARFLGLSEAEMRKDKKLK